MLNSSICQFAQWEANQRAAGGTEQWQAELVTYMSAAVGTGDYPHLASAMASAVPQDVDPDSIFDRGIGRIIDVILGPKGS